MFSTYRVEAQNDEDIIHGLLFELFYSEFNDYGDISKDTILISSRIYKTYFDFDSISFEAETGLKVPNKIILELKKNVEPDDFISFWDENKFNKGTDQVNGPTFKCLSTSEEDSLFERTKISHDIYSISKILFDDARETGIFYFLYTPMPGDVSGGTILIRKVFGLWVIVTRYGDFLT
jgi:hypothetical protein